MGHLSTLNLNKLIQVRIAAKSYVSFRLAVNKAESFIMGVIAEETAV